MDKFKRMKIIENLLIKTKNKDISWSRLVEHPDYDLPIESDSFLFDYLTKNLFIKSNDVDYNSNLKINKLESYYTRINEGLIYLFSFEEIVTWQNNILTIQDLAYQSAKNAKLHSFDANKENISRLQNLIEGSIDNNEGFLNSLLID